MAGHAPTTMDSLTYRYATYKNQLTYVDDGGTFFPNRVTLFADTAYISVKNNPNFNLCQLRHFIICQMNFITARSHVTNG
ncbi:MAG: hypothetical protein LH473_01450 [Chitinophagales bacterium]|nr:hypothetical protein [Chitinophagales bacterium]